ncbi:hypothetical protein CPB84DRAFT_1837963 [Gymnopilus junonius]|uniref:Uncharacterized protein n=1 Tax=Gymnopilus junonius TaxID=109634 RepID=A0A9P5TIK0_GYMJU|nr:hypothetical protein CPB84DRAFT_1837963 [Gymnopilus junonius]
MAADGTLGPSARVFDAGGVGQRATHITPPGKPPSFFSPGPDPLFTQGAVVVNQKARILATVNPGSNTVSLFHIDAEDPTKLTPFGKPANSGGEFPIAVTINSEGTTVCVLNGGAVNGVNCFSVNPILGLVPKPNTLRFLNVNQTTPPTGPLGSLSTIVFSHDESKLLTLVKGGKDVTPNAFLAAWAFGPDGSLSKNAVKSFTADDGRVPFTLVNIPGSNAYVAGDPTVGFEIFDFGNSTSLSATGISTPIPNQILACWVSYNPISGNFYIIDPVLSTITEVHFDAKLNSTIVKQYVPLANSGTLDNIVSIIGKHSFLHILQPLTSSITTLSVDRPGGALPVQIFNLTSALKDAGLSTYNNLNFQGMATYILK